MVLDMSNWTIDDINNANIDYSNLTDIGMINCDIDTINKVGVLTNATLWIDEDIDITKYSGTAPIEVYKEEVVEIKLNSPLLERDTIEVVDGKLSHVHRYGMMVLDGSEDEEFNFSAVSDTITSFAHNTSNAKPTVDYEAYCNNFKNIHSTEKIEHFYVEFWNNSNNFAFYVNNSKLSSPNKNGFKEWLQANPTTVVYQLAEPWIENIEPYQSEIVLKTFLESSMIINTNLPIETNVSYRTNVPSVTTLTNRVTEIKESDIVATNLIDMIDEEVDQ